MALMTTQIITRSGLTPVFSAVAASDTFTPDAQLFIEVKNAGAGADNAVPVVSTGFVPAANLSVSSATVNVPITTGDKMIGPLPAQFFADPTTGLGTITHSATASVTSGAFKLQQP